MEHSGIPLPSNTRDLIGFLVEEWCGVFLLQNS
uniref:Uncharacterized protein n=1 Tax=Anguilla anguilla TaxID=7936 RepID=A0A0E9Q7F1_ANGAN